MPTFIGISLAIAGIYFLYEAYINHYVVTPTKDTRTPNPYSMSYSSNFSNPLDQNLPLTTTDLEYGDPGRRRTTY